MTKRREAARDRADRRRGYRPLAGPERRRQAPVVEVTTTVHLINVDFTNPCPPKEDGEEDAHYNIRRPARVRRGVARRSPRGVAGREQRGRSSASEGGFALILVITVMTAVLLGGLAAVQYVSGYLPWPRPTRTARRPWPRPRRVSTTT